MSEKILIEMNDIRKSFPMRDFDLEVLKGLSLTIRQGEFVTLVGNSGSGKSTLMNLLGCLDRPTAGRYLLDGEDVSKLKRDELAEIRNQKLGFVFQNFNLLARTSALENVELPLFYQENVSPSERHKKAKEALERMGLGDRMDHHPSQLSGGQQQRVAIARALVTRPQIILADEPTGNLDSRSGEEVMKILKELNEEGVTFLMVTHDKELAQQSKRTVTMKDGEIIADHILVGQS
jgi:putative ABC transport system ATP-binding protein